MKIYFFLILIFFYSCKKKSGTILQSEAKTIENHINKTAKQDEKISILRDFEIKNEKYSYDSIVRNNLFFLATKYFQLNQPQDFRRVSEKLELLSFQNKDFEANVQSNVFLATFYQNNYNLDSAFYFYNKAEKQTILLKDNPFLTSIYLGKSDILYNKKDFLGSELKSIKALKIALFKNDYDDVVILTYIRIGNALYGMQNYTEALKYYEKAINTMTSIKDEKQKVLFKHIIYNAISKVYENQKQFKKILIYLNEKIDFAQIKNIEIQTYSYLINRLGHSKFKLGDKTAKSHFLETLKIGDSLQFAPIQITSKTYLGEYYLQYKDTLQANRYLIDAKMQAHKNAIFEDELILTQLLAKANPKKEGFYFNRYIALNDSLQNVERATRDKFARIEFETEEIKAQKEEVTLQNDSLRLRIVLLSAFALLILLVVVLLFKLQSNKAKTKELLLVQQQQKANEEIYQLMIAQQKKVEEGKQTEKQRISLELHDGVMGKLAAIRMNLYPLLMQANLVNSSDFYYKLDEIQSVEQEIRNIAHDLNTNLFSDNIGFVSIVEQLFAQIESHSNINFELLADDSVNWEVINNTIKINLFRILQEALQNIEKYAEAKKVIVAIKQEDHILFMSIADNGKGFDSTIKQSGIGLKNMKIRMLDCNGTFTLQSKPNEGTKINLTVPI
jgi:signal transduction histidine kinase